MKLISDLFLITVDVKEDITLTESSAYGMFNRAIEDILEKLDYYIYDEYAEDDGKFCWNKTKVIDYEFDVYLASQSKIVLFIALTTEHDIRQLETIKIIFKVKK